MRVVLTVVACLAGIVNAQSGPTDEASIRSVVSTFADARNAHNGPAVAALYSEDGEWISNRAIRTVRGRAALADLWGNLSDHVTRTVHSIDFPGAEIAVVRVDTLYTTIGLHHESFVFVKEQGKWLIRLHQSVD